MVQIIKRNDGEYVVNNFNATYLEENHCLECSINKMEILKIKQVKKSKKEAEEERKIHNTKIRELMKETNKLFVTCSKPCEHFKKFKTTKGTKFQQKLDEEKKHEEFKKIFDEKFNQKHFQQNNFFKKEVEHSVNIVYKKTNNLLPVLNDRILGIGNYKNGSRKTRKQNENMLDKENNIFENIIQYNMKLDNNLKKHAVKLNKKFQCKKKKAPDNEEFDLMDLEEETKSNNNHTNHNFTSRDSETNVALSSDKIQNSSQNIVNNNKKDENEVLINILKKPSNLRVNSDIKKAFSCLRNLKAFKKVSQKVLLQLIEDDSLNLETYNKNQLVFSQGDEGSNWFVVLVGEMIIIINGVTVGNIVPGFGFGELALIQSHGVRAATIMSSTSSVLLRIEKSDYNRILRYEHKRDRLEKVTMLRKLPVFSNLSELDIHSFSDCISIKSFKKGQIILKENDTLDEFCFIKKGTLSVWKNFDLNCLQEEEDIGIIDTCSNKRKHLLRKDEIKFNINGKFSRKIISNKKPIECEIDLKNEVVNNAVINETDANVIKIFIARLSEGEYFNEKIVHLHPNKIIWERSQVEIKCETDVEVGVVQRYNAWSKIPKEIPNILSRKDYTKNVLKGLYLDQIERKKWKMYKKKYLELIFREKFKDPNITLKMWEKNRTMKDNLSYRNLV
ncbi:hypothetical protein HK099_004902 [Clydaea vesicula]|uniref:Cyclic nucleotide-binding domain-containing protein n=1 Tax=Clydaea vesicula TaxID=447962 RepID=A0AAD5U170_9FUNG|nr:hypothetical protein HK099_004902 [Clydaea vesicula]